MNRAIIFRGQKTDNSGYAFGYYHFDNYQLQARIIDSNGDSFDVFSDSIEQFTGRKDKNGKDVYEGDWLRVCAGYSSRVAYDENQCAFLSYYSHPEDPEELLLCDLGDDFEVIDENK